MPSKAGNGQQANHNIELQQCPSDGVLKCLPFRLLLCLAGKTFGSAASVVQAGNGQHASTVSD
jgi:hypothetical protein